MKTELPFWSVHEAGPSRRRRLHVFGEIGSSEHLPEISNALGDGEVELWIDCGGGDTSTAMGLYGALRGRTPVATITGRCMSAAMMVAMAADHITAYPHARLMEHSSRAWVFGDAETLRERAAHIDRLNESVIQIIHRRTRIPIARLRSWFSREGRYMDASQAQAFGLIDEIIQPAAVNIPECAASDTTGQATQTDGERLLFDLLRALGKVTVKNQNQFIQNLLSWASTATHQQ